MHLGALVALAEVGIGINLAFGVVRQFRDWSRNGLLDTTKAACASMEAAIAELRAKGQSHSVLKAVEYDKWFEAMSTLINQLASAAAMACSLALFLFIYYVADHPDADCGYLCKRTICFMAIGPVLLSWLCIASLHGYVRFQLHRISKQHGHLIQFVKSLDLPISPTDPGGTPGSEPPKTPVPSGDSPVP